MGYASTQAYQIGLSLKQQEAYGTALPDLDITMGHPIGETDPVAIDPEDADNSQEYGKGHQYATEAETVAVDTSTNWNFQGSSLILGWVAALAMGNVTTTQPDEVLAPNTYLHKIKPLRLADKTWGLQLPVTSIVEQLCVGDQTKYRDMLCTGFKVSGEQKKRLQVSASFKGSGHYVASNITMPELAPVSFIRFGKVNFLYGGAAINAELQNFEFSYDNTVDEGGYHAGSPTLTADPNAPQCRGFMLISDQKVELKFKMLYKDNSLQTDLIAKTVKAITIEATGDLIEATYKHSWKLTIPQCTLKAAKKGKENGKYAYDVSVMIHWDETLEAPCEIEVQNDIPAYLETPGN